MLESMAMVLPSIVSNLRHGVVGGMGSREKLRDSQNGTAHGTQKRPELFYPHCGEWEISVIMWAFDDAFVLPTDSTTLNTNMVIGYNCTLNVPLWL